MIRDIRFKNTSRNACSFPDDFYFSVSLHFDAFHARLISPIAVRQPRVPESIR